MSDRPWPGDACALVDAFRKGDITPPEALELSLAAIEGSALNAFSHVDAEAACRAASRADVTLPFGGVPVGIKELEPVEGWPLTEASLVYADRVAASTSTQVRRLRRAGAVLAGQTTASEFGGINVTYTRLHGATRNPWNLERTPGGSSGGTAAAVAGGLLPIASGGDGGGSIRIPAAFTGMFGLKSNYGRIPKGPFVHQIPHTVTVGCISRSVRDTARWYDVCNGYDPHDTHSLPRVEGWEAGLGTHRQELRGKRAVVAVDLGVAVVHPEVAALVTAGAESLIADAGLARVEVAVCFPPALFEWAMSNLVTLAADLGDKYPACEPDLTPEIMLGLNIASHHYDLAMAATAERFRVGAHEVMADLLDEVDFIICSTNPDVAFGAEGPMPTKVGDVDLMERFGDIMRVGANQGNLTFPANFSGNPAVSIPVGTIDGLPVGMQVIGRHYQEELLLDLADMAERERPWPLVAPGGAALMMNGSGNGNGRLGAGDTQLGPRSTEPPAPPRFFARHRNLRNLLIVVVIVAGLVIGIVVDTGVKVAQRQNALQPFYDTTGLHLAGPLGQVVRSQPLGVHVDDGTGLRILYRTQRGDGTRTFSSGMVFIPDNDSAGTPRPVVAWAHGTVGLGPQCAPSRSAHPVGTISWVSSMLARGWVVTATDYAGLGTSGTSGYLVGDDEANDVLNSVRALKYIPAAHAGTSFAVWGHSQGGNSALFTAARVHTYAPELHLVATVASAPAAELVPLLNQTYQSTLAWVIGPEVLTSWPATYRGLPVRSILTSAGYDNYKRIAQKCITSAAAEGLVRNAVRQRFFDGNPVRNPRWKAIAEQQTAPVLAPTQPLLVAESLTDLVVLPDTTALYIRRACAAGSDLTSLWITDVGHIQLSSTIAPAVVAWLGDRFGGRPPAPTCDQPLPIAPASS